MEKLKIDRLEGDFVVCELEDKSIINIKKGLLPIEAKKAIVI